MCRLATAHAASSPTRTGLQLVSSHEEPSAKWRSQAGIYTCCPCLVFLWSVCGPGSVRCEPRYRCPTVMVRIVLVGGLEFGVVSYAKTVGYLQYENGQG